MNNKLKRSERKISSLFYDIIPALYWNDKGKQINLEWCYRFFCNMPTHYWVIGFQRFEVTYWSWPSKRRTGSLPRNFGNQSPSKAATYHGRKYSSLWIKPTNALISNFIGITTLHVSDSLSAHHQDFLAIYRHWYNLWSLLIESHQVQVGTAVPTCTWSHSVNCVNCTNADIRLRTPDDGQKACS